LRVNVVLRPKAVRVVSSLCAQPSGRVPRRHAVEAAFARWDLHRRRSADAEYNRARRDGAVAHETDAVRVDLRDEHLRVHAIGADGKPI
jgi:hypothetical protein